MSDVFAWHRGTSPLLISIPHDGRDVPPDIAARMAPAGLAIPDTDWHVRKLYGFARSAGAGLIAANYSRYVVDLNRSAADDVLYEGHMSTGLCPAKTFAGDPVYRDGKVVDEAETERRVDAYWRPYHRQIARALADIRSDHGYALLWDAHSIRSELPLLFSGQLPELNIGTNGGRSCPAAILETVAEAAGLSEFSTVANARFKGGYITRHYGSPEEAVFAMQLEVAQRCYMDESTLGYDEVRAAKLAATLDDLLAAYEAGSATFVASKALDYRDKKQ